MHEKKLYELILWTKNACCISAMRLDTEKPMNLIESLLLIKQMAAKYKNRVKYAQEYKEESFQRCLELLPMQKCKLQPC
jgi:hypothetical protein